MIYCVEDDDDILKIELYALKSAGLEARGFSCAGDFLNALKEKQPEMVILDVMLPDQDGVRVLESLRRDAKTRRIPVIMATARSAEIEKISALDSGADDYLTKPFSMMEMVARVKAVLRRSGEDHDAVFTLGGITINDSTHTVSVAGKEVILTGKEYDLLVKLVSHPGRVYSREQLLNQIWSLDYDGENRTVDVHVRTLRQKLGDAGDIIKTIRGYGYKAGNEELNP